MFFTKEEFDSKDHAMENHPQSFELFGKYENEEEMTITENGPVTDKNSINVSTSKRSNSVQRSAIIKEESCETDYNGISEGNYSGFHSEFVDVKEEPSVSSHVPNAFQGGNDLHSYIFNSSLPIPHPPNEDSSSDQPGSDIKRKKKSFPCPMCDKDFTQECFLNVHIVSDHVGIKPHKCDICGASFPHSRNLKVHIKTVHEGNKPHKCEICGNRFAEKGKLTRHIASVHEKKRPYSCNLCDGTFTSNQHLKGHISSVHDGLKPHSCDMCNASFARKSHLKRHKDKVHGEKDDNITLHGLPETSGFDEMPLESSMKRKK